MIVGIGTDLVQKSRIQNLYEKFGQKFVQRILSLDEQHIFEESHFSIAFLAKRFAAKEAVAKALGTGIGKIAFNEISVTNLPSGQPTVTFLGKALEYLKMLPSLGVKITLSDEKEYAIAFALIYHLE